jgi:hypothetical protein
MKANMTQHIRATTDNRTDSMTERDRTPPVETIAATRDAATTEAPAATSKAFTYISLLSFVIQFQWFLIRSNQIVATNHRGRSAAIATTDQNIKPSI